MTAHNQDVSDVNAQLGSDQTNGLNAGQVSDMRAKYGENKLREKRKRLPCSAS